MSLKVPTSALQQRARNEPMDGEGFGDLLRRSRQQAGMTQLDLAERSGLSVRGISDIERGLKQRPHPETVRMLADALNLSAEMLTTFRSTATPVVALTLAPLPVPATPLVGRSIEIDQIAAQYRSQSPARLVTLTGPGGVGKTRVGIRVPLSWRPTLRMVRHSWLWRARVSRDKCSRQSRRRWVCATLRIAASRSCLGGN